MEFLSLAAVQAAGAVLLIQQILKLKVIPLTFANKYPVPTNVILSVIGTIVFVRPVWSFDNIGNLALQITTIGVIAAIAYNQLFGKSEELKAMEG